MSLTYHSEIFNLGFNEKHDTWQSHTSAKTVFSGLMNRIFEKVLSPVNDTWKCFAMQTSDIREEFSEENVSFLVFYPAHCACFPSCHTTCWWLWATRCLSHGTAESIPILPAPTMGDSFGHRGRLASNTSLWREFSLNRTCSAHLTLPNYQFHGEASGNHINNCCLLSLRAVAVHAPICRLAAGLTGHPVPHLHGQPCLSAPLDGAPQLLAPCFCGDKREAPIAPCHRSWAALRGTAAMAHHRSTCQKHSKVEITDLYQIFHFKITFFFFF